MATLQTLKIRIKSVKSTQKMTNAMKLVSASKLRKAKEGVIALRPYASKIKEIVDNVAGNMAVKGQVLTDFPLLSGFKEKTNQHLLVVISSDRGLCGGLNSSVVKIVKNKISQLQQVGEQVKIICIGKKSYEQLFAQYKNLIIEYIPEVFKNQVKYQAAKEISDKIINIFIEHKFDFCDIIYNEFKSAIVQDVIQEQIIPVVVNTNNVSNSALHYEQNKTVLLSSILPENITSQVFHALLENSASEYGARMAAMEAATTNANKMIKSLTLTYNRLRQANITKELIDIVSGANAAA
ncbi:ATP synthase F1 subunit gamma [Flavobacteriaceae bacterium]|nr:ATP synthase F1 subunit gamma [Flavobacteriaceae bacterium]